MTTNATNNGNIGNDVKNNVVDNANNAAQVLAANSKRALAILAKAKEKEMQRTKDAGKAPKAEASAPKAEDKKGKGKATVKKEGTVTLASLLDKLILTGGKWETLIDSANAAAKKVGATTKFSRGVLTAHINYRLLKNKSYLGNYKVTDAGVVTKGGKAKKAA